MPEKQPEARNFAKKKVGGTTAKTTRKTPIKKLNSEPMNSAPEIPRKKPTRRKPMTATRTEPLKNKELNERLNNIYKDKNGRIPNMREIRVRKTHPILRGFFTLLIVAGLMAATAWAGFFYLPGNQEKNAQQLNLKIEGPENAEMGATTTYKITFQNQEDITLKNLVISVNYPETFVFDDSSLPAENAGHTEWRVGDLAPQVSGHLEITGRYFGEPEKSGSWRVFINFQPENFNSEMQENITLETKIMPAPVALSIAGPDKVLLGDDAEYLYRVTCPEEYAIKNFKIKPELPENFLISSSSPALDKDGVWIYDAATKTDAPTPAELKIIGKFTTGGESVVNTIVAIGGTVLVTHNDRDFNITRADKSVELAQNKYSLNLAINGSLEAFNSQPGEMLNITAQFKNTGEEPLKNVQIKINLDSPSLKGKSCLNWGELTDELSGGIIGTQLTADIRRGQINWNKNQLPELAMVAPGAQVEIDLQIPIQTMDKFDMSALKESVITAILEAEYTDQSGQEKQATGNKIDITLNSDLALEVRSREVTEDGVEKRRITWLLSNSFHPLKNVKLTTELFGRAEFVTPEELPAGSINYQNEEKRVTWNIPEMPLELETVAITFDVIILEKDPTQDAIMGKVALSAEDTVTGQTIYLAGEEIKI